MARRGPRSDLGGMRRAAMYSFSWKLLPIRAYLILVGDGQLRPDIETKVAQAGLSERV